MSAVSDFILGKKRPAFLCGKRRLLAQSWRNLLQTINNRSIANCVQRLRLVYVRAVRFTSAHLTQISRGSLNAFGPFLKLENKTLIFPETNSSGDDNQQGPQASTPQQIAELFNSYFESVFTAPSGVRTWSALFTSSHPTLNELEIPVEMVLTSLKQLDINKATGSDGIPVRLLKETAKSLRLGIFPGDWKLENIVPFSRKERELPPYFPSPCHLQSSRVPPHHSRTAWLFSR